MTVNNLSGALGLVQSDVKLQLLIAKWLVWNDSELQQPIFPNLLSRMALKDYQLIRLFNSDMTLN